MDGNTKKCLQVKNQPYQGIFIIKNITKHSVKSYNFMWIYKHLTYMFLIYLRSVKFLVIFSPSGVIFIN